MKPGFLCWSVPFFLCALSAPALAEDAPAGANLEAGGLKPPDAVQSDQTAPPPSPTEANLDRADKEDSGRGLEFVWLNGEVGAETLGLQTFKANNLVDAKLVNSKQTGIMYGAGVGVRLLVFTLGARFRLGNFSDWDLWTLNGEFGLHIPLGRVEPYFNLGAGYASLGSFDSKNIGSNLSSAGLGAKGLDVRGAFGVDVYLTDTFTVGGNLSGDLLVLSRSGKSVAAGATTGTAEQQAAANVYAKDGSSVGAGATLSAVLGLHF